MKNNKVAKIIMQIFWISLIVAFWLTVYEIHHVQEIENMFIFGKKELLVIILFFVLLIIYIIYYRNQNYTNYKKQELNITSILIFNFITTLIFIYSFKTNFKPLMISLFGIYLFFLIFKLIGKLRAYYEINKVNKNIKKNNSYIYYRELPNSFGIGIITLLFDSTLENEKDIVAVILDLCAKKYLSLIKNNDKYIIKVLKPIDNNLLSNEMYILDLIINNELKNIDYNTWYKKCVNDGINLGLYTYEETKFKKFRASKNKIIIIIEALLFVLGIILSMSYVISFIHDINSALFAGEGTLLFIMLLFLSFIIMLCIIKVANLVLNSLYGMIFKNYKDVKDNYLIITDKGKEELQKLYSFRAFIKDFGNFAPKEAKEIVLWDRYLSYAQVFGLTKEIMQTGYSELVNNASFQIDNIDNITFDNIEILK